MSNVKKAVEDLEKWRDQYPGLMLLSASGTLCVGPFSDYKDHDKRGGLTQSLWHSVPGLLNDGGDPDWKIEDSLK